VLVVTTFETDQDVYRALDAGAAGYLLKDAPEERIVSAVRGVAGGATVLDASVTRRLLAAVDVDSSLPGPPPALEALTSRELDVLRLLAQGLSNAGIARRLLVGEATVKTHVARVLTKLGLSSRSEAVVAAYESGLVRPRRGE
jgi:DNA-binding NarL/FixJ family response regulator